MKKNRIPFIPALLLSVLLLCAGCERQRYREEEAAELTARGREIAQTWIGDALPGAEILSAENEILQYPSGPSFLTGYVNVACARGGDRMELTVNAQTGQIYLAADMERVAEIARPYILEAMGLQGDVLLREFEVALDLPYAFEGKSAADPPDAPASTRGVLPAELALLLSVDPGQAEARIASYIADPANRDVLNVRLWADVGDSTPLWEYDLQRIGSIEADFGLKLDSFSLSDSAEEVGGSSRMTEYARWEWTGLEGFRLRVLCESCSELKHTGSGRIDVQRETYDARDIAAEQTPDGFRFSYREGGTAPRFLLYADDGAALPETGCTVRQADGRTWSVHWVFLEGTGLWVLSDQAGAPFRFTQPAELVITG